LLLNYPLILISIIERIKKSTTNTTKKNGDLEFFLNLLFKLLYSNKPDKNIGMTLPAILCPA